MSDMNPLGLKPDSIVYCTKTNSVLYARDALFDADWKAYRHEEFPAGEPFFVVPADEPAGEPTDLIAVAVDVTEGDEAGDAGQGVDDEVATDEPAADEPAGEDYPNARHNGRRHNGNRGR